MDKYKYILFFLVLFGSVWTALFFCHSDKTDNKIVQHHTDTVFVYFTDTLILYEPKYVTQRILDTVYIKQDEPLLVTQKHYSQDSVYDAWVSGINQQLDSIRTYQQTKYVHTTSVIEKVVSEKKWNTYAYGGINSFSGTFTPCLGVTLATPQKYVLSGEIGFSPTNYYYGIRFGIKLNN